MMNQNMMQAQNPMMNMTQQQQQQTQYINQPVSSEKTLKSHCVANRDPLALL
jgi:hypothetical protein